MLVLSRKPEESIYVTPECVVPAGTEVLVALGEVEVALPDGTVVRGRPAGPVAATLAEPARHFDEPIRILYVTNSPGGNTVRIGIEAPLRYKIARDKPWDNAGRRDDALESHATAAG